MASLRGPLSGDDDKIPGGGNRKATSGNSDHHRRQPCSRRRGSTAGGGATAADVIALTYTALQHAESRHAARATGLERRREAARHGARTASPRRDRQDARAYCGGRGLRLAYRPCSRGKRFSSPSASAVYSSTFRTTAPSRTAPADHPARFRRREDDRLEQLPTPELQAALELRRAPPHGPASPVPRRAHAPRPADGLPDTTRPLDRGKRSGSRDGRRQSGVELRQVAVAFQQPLGGQCAATSRS